ncbi:calcium-binding protein CML38-like, partial [Trifolium medium]|nr:calcium-binding protein CML38-like [Trifolium medium]
VSYYERVFSHLDGNRNGKISPAELQQCLEAIGQKLSAKETEAVVAYLDTDGDELLRFDDFARFLEGWNENEEDRLNDL